MGIWSPTDTCSSDVKQIPKTEHLPSPVYNRIWFHSIDGVSWRFYGDSVDNLLQKAVSTVSEVPYAWGIIPLGEEVPYWFYLIYSWVFSTFCTFQLYDMLECGATSSYLCWFRNPQLPSAIFLPYRNPFFDVPKISHDTRGEMFSWHVGDLLKYVDMLAVNPRLSGIFNVNIN